MNIKNIFIKALLTLFCLIAFTANAADIQVKVDRTQIELNETFTLIFESNEEPDDEPDFSPLEKDFQILNTGTSSNISIINGKYTRSKKWNLSLIARHKGTITIPPISFGRDSSPGYQITIKQPQKSNGKQGEAFISELISSSDSAYPQQQVIITQRLLSSSNINAYEFSPLKTHGVEVTIETLGEVKQYQTSQGNTPYLVLEQSYAIYPQSAGKLEIEPSVASARVALQGSRNNRSPFDPFRSNTKTVRRSSDGKTISIKPVPDSFKAKHWLVAKEVQLVEEFPETKSFKTGEPITRTLLLVADGQTAAQLPEFAASEIKGLKQYPDKPLLKNNMSEDGITGAQQLKIALIPSSAGSYTLPAISVPWWNTQTNKMEISTIKSRTFKVSKASGSNLVTPEPADSNTAENITKSENTPQSSSASSADSNIASTDNSLPWKLTTLILATGLLITLFLLWKNKSIKPATDIAHKNETPSLKLAIKNIKQACDKADAQEAKDALLEWGRVLFNNKPINSLTELSNNVDQSLADKINALNVYLYRNNTGHWKCDDLFDLCQTFTKNYKEPSTITDTNNLESLYK